MKKFILILFILALSILAGGFFLGIPYGFHTIVHKKMLGEVQSLQGKINYEAVSFNHHQSTFLIETSKDNNSLKVELSSITEINPLKNHLKFVISNTENPEQSFEFRLYAKVTEEGKLKFHIMTQDLDIKSPELAIASKGLSLEFGDFAEADFPKDKKPEILELLFNKTLKLNITDISLDNNVTSLKLKNFSVSFSIKEAGNKLSFVSYGKGAETATVIKNNPQFFKDSQFDFSLGSFDTKETIKFFQNFDANNPMALNPMFLGMSLMNIIDFPLELSFNSKANIDNSDIKMNLNANMLNRNIMDKSTFDASLDLIQTRSYIEMSLIPMLAQSFGKKQAQKYAPIDFKNGTPEQVTKQKIMQKEITKFVSTEFTNKKSEFLDLLINENFLKQEGSNFQMILKYQAGSVDFAGKSYSLMEFMDLPNKLGYKFFGSEAKFRQELKNAGIKL